MNKKIKNLIFLTCYNGFFIVLLMPVNQYHALGDVMYINSILSVKILSKVLLVFLVLMTGGPITKAFAETIVLKMEVSHPRNVDQMSLTFKERTVEFVTNVFQINSQDQAQSPQLGQFEISMTSIMNSLKRILRSYYRMLTVNSDNGLDLSSIIKAIGNAPVTIPHAPILHLNDYRVPYYHTYFLDIRNTFREVREEEWNCVHCAEYRKDGRSILRVIKKRGQREQKRKFSTRALNCYRLDQKRLECIDPQFGIFEIIM